MEENLKHNNGAYWQVIKHWENAFAIYASKVYGKHNQEDTLAYIRLEVMKELQKYSFYSEKNMWCWIQNAYGRYIRKLKKHNKETSFIGINKATGEEYERTDYDISGKFDWSIVDKPEGNIFDI